MSIGESLSPQPAPSCPSGRLCNHPVCQSLLSDNEEALREAKEEIARLEARIDIIDKIGNDWTEVIRVGGGGERRIEEKETVL